MPGHLKRHLGAASAALLVSAVPAVAEVCDKSRPAWNPSDGKVSQLDDVLLVFGSFPGVAFLILLAVSLLLRSRILCLLTSGFAAIWLLFLALEWLVEEKNDVLAFAIMEGCVTTPYAVSLLLAISILCCLTVGLSWPAKKIK
ncbi:hypothetical protein [Roseibium sp. Sym1]|uniref:hypothetical protein n=1 Tax=Roseibium sp. Sym1 TaxID=3016006 RepID=UPI0022B4841F|nr:hypothetical protein [Roseibium sp. Sym1]